MLRLSTAVVWVVAPLLCSSCSMYDGKLLGHVEQAAAGSSSQVLPTLTIPVAGCADGGQAQAPYALQSCERDAGQLPDAHQVTVACDHEGAGGSCGSNVELDAGVDGGATVESEPDQCPSDDAKLGPGACGCGHSDADGDGDGTADCVDSCPRDPAKTSAGVCGCGQADADGDGDGTADCVDACPEDAAKTAVGACGCHLLDLDADADGTPDCHDGCPADSHKTEAGSCGCGQSEPADPRAGALYCAKSALVHRYGFEGDDAVAADSVGTAPGAIRGSGALQAAGAVTFIGETGALANNKGYVLLPSAAWAGLRSATFECWVTWLGRGPVGDEAWQRIFDFGDQRAGEAESYIFLTPSGHGGVRTAFSLASNDAEVERSVVTPSPLPLHVMKHVAVVFDERASLLTLYVDGASQGSTPVRDKLTDIRAQNLWLGRSNFDNDPAFFGSIHEFRIYATALNDEQVAASFDVGPDYVFWP